MINFKGIFYDIQYMNFDHLQTLYERININCGSGKQAHNLKRLYLIKKEIEKRKKEEFRIEGAL